VFDEEKLRKEFERMKGQDEVWEITAEDENDIRVALLEEMEANSTLDLDEFNAVLDREFSVFKDGQKHDYITDMKDAFA